MATSQHALLCVCQLQYRILAGPLIKRRVCRAEFKINTPAFIPGPSLYMSSWRFFQMGILYQDYMWQLHTSSLSTILFEFMH